MTPTPPHSCCRWSIVNCASWRRTGSRALPPGQTLQPTALVHEVYLRLLGKHDLRLENRRQFFSRRRGRCAISSWSRHAARPGRNAGEGGGAVALNEQLAIIEPPSVEVQDLHEALKELEQMDPLKARIVELRDFAGMSTKEAANVLGVSERTLHRHWRFIKALAEEPARRAGLTTAQRGLNY